MATTGKTIILADGRRLGYAEYGDVLGRPLFLFHGQPGNRLFRHPDESLTASTGVRLIVPDRPGYGLSDFQPGRILSDWAKDVLELADALGIERFAILGFSAGGPYALSCAYQVSHRLISVGIADSAPPMHLAEINHLAAGSLRINHWLARNAPTALSMLFRLFWWFSRQNPNSFVQMAQKQSPQADREILSQSDIFAILLETWQENLRVDCRGYIQDVNILMDDWGFELGNINMKVHLWQGEVDTNTPPQWARYLAKKLPSCEATFFPAEGHFAIFKHWREILQVLTQA